MQFPGRFMKWQWVSGEGHYEYQLFLAAPEFVLLRATFLPWVLYLWVFAPEYFSLCKFSLDNVPRERCFCGGPTLFLW